MLNLGYSMLCQEIIGKILARRMNPALGIAHSSNEHRDALAYDLMEEWRPVLVDSVVMSMINGKEIHVEQFSRDEETGGIRLGRQGMKLFLAKMANRMEMKQKYISPYGKEISYREAISYQVERMGEAIVHQDPELYDPIAIR